MVKNPPAPAGDAGDMGWIPGLGRSLGGGRGNLPPPQRSYLGNSTDRGTRRAAVLGVEESDTTKLARTQHGRWFSRARCFQTGSRNLLA